LKILHYWQIADERVVNPISGAENHFMALLPALHKQGIDITLLAGCQFIGPKVAAILEKLREQGVKIEILKLPEILPSTPKIQRKLIVLSLYYRTWKAFRRHKNKIFHLHLNLLYFPLIAKMAGIKKIVCSVHADLPAYNKIYYEKWFKLLVKRKVKFIAITNHVKNHLIKAAKIPSDSIYTIHYGVPLPQASKKILKREDIGCPSNKFLIGFIGRLTSQKNIFLLLNALSAVNNNNNDIHLVIMGEGPLKESLLQVVETLGIKNQVHFCGYIQNAVNFMTLFDVFCLPSDWEGLGLVLIEAMYQKVPVIGSTGGAIPEILANGKYGLLFNSGDEVQLQNCILKVYQDKQKAQLMAAESYKYAINNFKVSTMAKKTIEVYQSINFRHA
jgi:glycosyltransferase involved in cell wall biosynthesis